MILKSFRKPVCRRRRSGIVLVMTVIVLVVLVSILYRLGANLSQWKHRQQYVIDYQKARYGCESGLKYALAVIDEIDPNTYVERPNEPDFSDLFAIGDACATGGQGSQQRAHLVTDTVPWPSGMVNAGAHNHAFKWTLSWAWQLHQHWQYACRREQLRPPATPLPDARL